MFDASTNGPAARRMPTFFATVLEIRDARVLRERCVVLGRHDDPAQNVRAQVRELARDQLGQPRPVSHGIPFDQDDFDGNAALGKPRVIEPERCEEPFVEVAAPVVVAAGDDDAEEGRRRGHLVDVLLSIPNWDWPLRSDPTAQTARGGVERRGRQ